MRDESCTPLKILSNFWVCSPAVSEPDGTGRSGLEAETAALVDIAVGFGTTFEVSLDQMFQTFHNLSPFLIRSFLGHRLGCRHLHGPIPAVGRYYYRLSSLNYINKTPPIIKSCEKYVL